MSTVLVTRAREMLAHIAVLVRHHQGYGRVADYIPELAQISPQQFGMAFVSVEGECAYAGDVHVPFSLQSITKAMALLVALNIGGDQIWERVGKEPSGTPFNFLAQIEAEEGVPRNPFVNAGALVVTDYLIERLGTSAEAIRDFFRVASQNHDIGIDERVASSELEAAHRNRAIANILASHGTIRRDPDRVLSAYCRQCAIEMPLLSLTRAFVPLASGGFSPFFGGNLTTPSVARRVNALMMTSGMYDSVGSFAYRVGLPAKSGVGGGIIAIAPRVGAIGVWGPELDRSGNSLIGTIALEHFVRSFELSVL